MISPKLKDRVAVITGANRGLGRSMALALANAGATIALVARNRDLLEQTATEITDAGGKAAAFDCDITDEERVGALAGEIVDALGGVHILINNAGMNNRKTLEEFTYEEWRRIVDTNLNGAFLMCKALVPRMKGNGYGRIINMTSILSHVALPGRTGYCTTKFGLLGFTKALALELIQDGITVNGISPGPFATEMNHPVMNDPEKNRQFLAKMPIGRWGDPREIGELAVYLCSEESGFVTGTDIVIDGGWTAL